MTTLQEQNLLDAARAHSNLNAFAIVMGIMEGGTIYGDNAAARKIIRICRDEQQRQLRAYDRAAAAVSS